MPDKQGPALDTYLPAGVFFGRTVERREAAGFTLSESRYPPGLNIPKHAHASTGFCFVLRGSYTEYCGSQQRVCSPSTLILHPQGEEHSDRHDPVDVSLFCIEIQAERLDAVREHSIVLETAVDFQGATTTHLASRLYQEFRRDDAVSALAIEGLMLELMAEASRHLVTSSERRPPHWLRQARDMVQAHCATSLTLGEIADAVHVHPVHLAREFRRHYQCTVGDYVRALRIEDACRHLADSGETLGEIALSVGFADQSHFTRTFKRLIGMTPAEYRRVSSTR